MQLRPRQHKVACLPCPALTFPSRRHAFLVKCLVLARPGQVVCPPQLFPFVRRCQDQHGAQPPPSRQSRYSAVACRCRRRCLGSILDPNPSNLPTHYWANPSVHLIMLAAAPLSRDCCGFCFSYRIRHAGLSCCPSIFPPPSLLEQQPTNKLGCDLRLPPLLACHLRSAPAPCGHQQHDRRPLPAPPARINHPHRNLCTAPCANTSGHSFAPTTFPPDMSSCIS